MTKTLYIETTGHQRRYALLENGQVRGFFQENSLNKKNYSDNSDFIYHGIVRDVMPGAHTCFVDIGESQNGFLRLKQGQSINEGQKRLVQIKKAATQDKGALLSPSISLCGRHIVLLPYKRQHKISRQIQDKTQITRLKNWLNQQSDHIGITLRSDAQFASDAQLNFELNWLYQQFNSFKSFTKPACVYKPAAGWLTLFNLAQIDKIVVDNVSTQTATTQALQASFWMATSHPEISLKSTPQTLFNHIGIARQIDNLYCPRVKLPGGGELIIEKTTALYSIDINSGSDSSHNDFVDQALSVNLEAVQVIAEQIYLRNLSGIIMLDFINMPDKHARVKLMQAIRDAFADDTAIRHIGTLSFAGVVELVRTHRGPDWLHDTLMPCDSCLKGQQLTPAHVAYNLLRELQYHITQYNLQYIVVTANVAVIDYLHQFEHDWLQHMQTQFNLTIELQKQPQCSPIGYHINSQ